MQDIQKAFHDLLEVTMHLSHIAGLPRGTRSNWTSTWGPNQGIQTITTEKARLEALALSQEETRKAAAEHEKATQLLAAGRVEELRAQAEKLAPEMERHQVPVEHLANPELAQALQRAHNAKTPKAAAAAAADIKEQMFLIGKDGIDGPDINQLRKETKANVNGANDSHFKDLEFVKAAAKEMHEA